MNMSGFSIFGSASWPVRRGNPFNSNVSPVKATGRGEPLWSVALPERGANGIAVAEDGTCFVNLDNHFVAVTPREGIRWTTQANYALSTPIVLADGRLIVYENHTLAIREQATGKPLSTLPSYYATMPAITPQGHLVYSGRENADKASQFQMMTLAGQRIWTLPVGFSQLRAPLVLNDLIITTDKSYMRAFNLEGELQWIADQEGFILANPDTCVQLTTKDNPIKSGLDDRVVSPIIGLGDGQVLAGLEWYSGAGYYLFDIHNHSVRPLGKHLLLKKPLAVPLLPERGPCLVTKGPSVKDKLGMRRSSVVMVDMNGQTVWEHQLPIPPSAIIADASGNIFIISSPSFDRWDKYRVWYKLEEECFVRGLSPEGKELFTWYAPGPISPSMAIGKNGELYVVAEGKLWAVG